MQIQSAFRSRVVFASLFLLGLTVTPSLAQTSAPVKPAIEAEKTPQLPAPSGTGPRVNQPRPITNQAEWQNAVAQTLKRRAARLVRDPSLLDLEGKFALMISFSLSPDGSASDAKVTKSSGQAAVDAAAMKVFDGALKFPAFSPDMNKDKPMKLTAPLQFMLEKPAPVPEQSANPSPNAQ